MPKHHVTLKSIMSPVIKKLNMDESFNIHKYGVRIILIILVTPRHRGDRLKILIKRTDF